jgi:hypothetical protein
VHSLRSHEGELLIDHRNSPGVPEEIMVATGLPAFAGKKDSVFECATFTCADCETVVYINPKRNRPRGYCPKCDHYLCDDCEAIRFMSGGQCFNRKIMIDRILNKLASMPVASNVFQSPMCITTVDAASGAATNNTAAIIVP